MPYTVDVIICIHNALDDVKNCIESVLRTEFTAGTYRLILVDDGSDAPTADYVKQTAAGHENITSIRRDKAGGYTIAANTGLRASQADFCALLNSDTIVPKNWLNKFTALFTQKPDVGIIGPLSNAASWQSIPDLSAPEGGWAVNSLPKGWSVDDMDAAVERAAQDIAVTPRVPLLNGFCYMIRRSILDGVGLMDEEGFPRGFGEEDDFCMRTALAGYGIMIALNTYVYHAKSKSYGSKARNSLSQKGQVMLKKKHGEIRLARAVASMRHNPYLAEMRLGVAELLPR
jgi:GT2 family glycosyltransferase